MSSCCEGKVPAGPRWRQDSPPLARRKRLQPAWKALLRSLAGPALRLHHYRELRNAMIYHALSPRRDRPDC